MTARQVLGTCWAVCSGGAGRATDAEILAILGHTFEVPAPSTYHRAGTGGGG